MSHHQPQHLPMSKRTHSSSSQHHSPAAGSAHQSTSSSKRSTEKTHMESAVTKLLVSTRELLSSLTDWSQGKITENDVSDFYVKLGNDFNVAVSAFTALDIPMQDLLSVPAVLRDCLERCINEEPTPQNLERALPEIRTTIVNLLQGLKTKQAVYKARRDEDKRTQRNVSGSSPGMTDRDRSGDTRRSGESRRSGEERRQRTPEPPFHPSPQRHGSPLPPTPQAYQQAPLPPPPTEDRTRWQPPTRSGSGGAPPHHQHSASGSMSRPLPPQPTMTSSRLPQIQTAPQPQVYPERTPSTSSSIYSAYAPSIIRPHDAPDLLPSDSPSMSKRSVMPSSSSSRPRPQAARPGDPLPAPPPDAFRPPRRTGGGSGDSLERSRSPMPGDERSASRSSQNAGQGIQSPSSPIGSLPPDIRRTRSPTQDSLGRGPPPMAQSQSHQPTLVAQTGGGGGGPTSPRPIIRHSLSDPSSPTAATQSFAFQQQVPPPQPPIVTAASPPSSPDKLPPIPISSPLLSVTPPMVTQPLPLPSPAQLQLDSTTSGLLPAPPVPNSIADQTLSNLRGSGNAISRRASQRYSLYQIEKISDSVPSKREKSSRRVSGMMGIMKEASTTSSPSAADRLMGSSGASPARPVRADRPPVPVGGSPLRGGGFVPPAEDQGVEVGVEDETSGAGLPPPPPPPVMRMSRSQSGIITPKRSLEPALASLGEEDELPSPLIPKSKSFGRSSSLSQLAERAEEDSDLDAIDHATEPVPVDLPTVFLLHGKECKRVQLSNARPSIPVLRMLFMEKFGFATEGGEEWPAIYVQDPKTEWRYEWEETEDLADGVRLSLNIEPLDQVKAHIDLQMSGLSRKLEDLIRDSVAPLSSQFATFQASNVQSHRLSQVLSTNVGPGGVYRSPSPNASPQMSKLAGGRLHPGAAETTGMFESPRSPGPENATLPPPALSSTPVSPAGTTPAGAIGSSTVSARVVQELKAQFEELQTLRRDLGVARQIHVDGIKSMKDIFSALRRENQRVREIATTTLSGGRAFVEAGKVKIDSQSQTVLRKVEDLQDVIEELYTDVTEKLVVPRPTMMRSLKKDITEAETQLQDLVGATKLAASTWRTTWSQEMENVMAEEKQLKYHLAFTNDIEEDFTNLQKVFGQIEMYAAQRTAAGTGGTVGRGRGYRPPSPTERDPAQSLSSVLFEIQGSRVDPDKRLKAIENAAKMRQRELDEKRGADDVLQTQLSDFVEGRKLKKTGGVEETERLRQRKNELAMRGGVPLPPTPITGLSSVSISTSSTRSPSLRSSSPTTTVKPSSGPASPALPSTPTLETPADSIDVPPATPTDDSTAPPPLAAADA